VQEEDWAMATSWIEHGRRPVALALTLLVAGGALTACGGSGSASADARTRDRTGSAATGFEDGTTGPFRDHEGTSVTRAAARNGAFGLDIHPRGADAYATWNARGAGSFWSFRAWVRIVSWTPDQSVDVFTIRNLQARNNFDLFVDAPQRTFRWDLFRSNTARDQDPVNLGQWHLLEARGSFATAAYTAEVRVDGTSEPGITSPDQVPSAVRDVILGPGGTTKTNELQLDDVRAEVAQHPLPLPGPPRTTGGGTG
jgi:hypothetical protein